MTLNPAYVCAVDEIFHASWSSRKLRRIEMLKQSIQHYWPQGHPSKLIHVAGTNGKGSTCRLLEAAFEKHGGAGAMVNPHLYDYRERFSLAGAQPSHDEIARLWHEEIKPHSLHRARTNQEDALTFAEASLLIALHLFANRGLAFGILETGVGGRYAPTMALQPALCLLTNVGEDHTVTLGSALWQRALEKAGIARPLVPLITGAEGEALEVIQATASQVKAPFKRIDDSDLHALRRKLESPALSQGCALPPSEHFIQNACLALEAARTLAPNLVDSQALAAMQHIAPLQGRFESPREGLLVDVAHNPDKLAALGKQLKSQFGNEKFHLIFGVSRKRPSKAMLAPLLGQISEITFTTASYAGRPPEEVLEEFEATTRDRDKLPVQIVQDPAEALAQAEAKRKEGELILITGSAYTIDQALNPDPFMKTLNAEFGRRGASS
jgi:dihydrofolate synthase / folylpolyglutamate synthase